MHALLIEAVPSTALGALAITLEELLAVVAQHVVLAGDEVDLFGGGSLLYLIERIELTRLRELAEIAGVNNEIWFLRHGVNLVDCRLQSRGNIWIGRFVKADVAIADLHKGEVRAF